MSRKRRLKSKGNKYIVAGASLIAFSLATTAFIPFAGLADEVLIPLGMMLISKGMSEK